FSSRRRHTRSKRDWSSDVCSSDLEAFVLSAAMNYYAIAALVLLWLTILMGLDLGSMRREEERAVDGDGLQNPKDDTPDPFADDMPKHDPGAMRALVLPFMIL